MSVPEFQAVMEGLRIEIRALTKGLLIQQEMLRIMDAKLTALLDAATKEVESEGPSPVENLLTDLVALVRSLTEGQATILGLLLKQQQC